MSSAECGLRVSVWSSSNSRTSEIYFQRQVSKLELGYITGSGLKLLLKTSCLPEAPAHYPLIKEHTMVLHQDSCNRLKVPAKP